MTSLMAFIRRHFPMFGVVKFCAGLVIGFGLGVRSLPTLTAEKGLDTVVIEPLSQSAFREGIFVRDLPGPDYRLYLIPKYVEKGLEFMQIKADSIQIGPIKAFEFFLLDISADFEVTNFPAALILCEAFGQFITAARLQ